MMNRIDTIKPLEPVGKIPFRSKKGLLQHVIKHVLNNRDERWHQLFDADAIAEARREYEDKQSKAPAFWRICHEYHATASNALSTLCKEGKGHRHLFWERMELFSEEAAPFPADNSFQSIEAWDISQKLVMIAKSYVRNGEFGPYMIHTSYRAFPKLKGNALKKRIVRQLQERRALKNGTELALHDSLSCRGENQ